MVLEIQFLSLAGKMHPLIVHLPIGILIAGFLLQWLSRNGKNPTLRPALLPVYLAGCIAAMLSCVSGYLLSLTDDYDESILGTHQWMGIGVAIISFVLFLGVRGLRWFTPFTNIIAIVLFGGILYTAHLGGTLTHGSNFLFSTNAPEEKFNSFIPLADAQEAVVYSDIIQPILQVKCYACHGPHKQKGKLRLDGKENILKGGKIGKVIVPVNDPEPELLKRILLPPDDEDHMPPKEKGQLSSRQVILIKWWLDQGADFTARAKELKQTDTIKKALASLQKATEDNTGQINTSAFPELPPAPVEIIDSLKRSGVIVLPLSLSVNALSVNLINATRLSDTIWSQISRISDHIFFLSADGKLTGNNAMAAISTLKQLRNLSLANTMVTDDAILLLQPLQELVTLNLTGTKITERGLAGLGKLKKLKRIYVYQAAINRDSMEKLKQLLPGVTIDTGGYTLPVLITDTQVVKPKKT